MDPAIWGFLGAILGALVGGIASVGISLIATREKLKMVKMERQDRINIEVVSFQRETLLALQDELISNMRYLFKFKDFLMEDFSAMLELGAMRPLLDEELVEHLMKKNASTAVLIQRILNEELRTRLIELKDSMFYCQSATSAEECAEYWKKSEELYGECSKSIGKQLRKTYELNDLTLFNT